jgi:hypothetical protein
MQIFPVCPKKKWAAATFARGKSLIGRGFTRGDGDARFSFVVYSARGLLTSSKKRLLNQFF